MTREESVAREELQLSEEEIRQCTKNAIVTAFASDEVKQQLLDMLKILI